MSETIAGLQRKINGAKELGSVVRTMKALAAANIGQYESALHSLDDYYRSVELGLLACFKQTAFAIPAPEPSHSNAAVDAIVFGSDQGLVGQFNDVLLEFVTAQLRQSAMTLRRIWAIGERIHARLSDAEQNATCLTVPTSVQHITPLITRLLIDSSASRRSLTPPQLLVFHNRPLTASSYAPAVQRLLPLDEEWQRQIATQAWPTRSLPQTIGAADKALAAFVHEYLFVSLFKACAESLAAENSSRLLAMQRAEKNIGEMLDELQHAYHQQRQASIDAELFDLLAGFESLPPPRHG